MLKGIFRLTPLYLAPKDVIETLRQEIDNMLSHDRVVIFLTGTPMNPRCRFTRMTVDIFHQLDIPYSYVNIAEDDEICEGIKVYSDWPTFPQIYVDKELIGGYDIIASMLKNKELTHFFENRGLVGNLQEKK